MMVMTQLAEETLTGVTAAAPPESQARLMSTE
jgi:hypothetical protein